MANQHSDNQIRIEYGEEKAGAACEEIVESDAVILARSLGVRDDLDDLARYTARLPMDID